MLCYVVLCVSIRNKREPTAVETGADSESEGDRGHRVGEEKEQQDGRVSVADG